jgi:hypothetical protein
VVCGFGALLADLSTPVPSYIRLAAVVNIVGGFAGLSVLYWRKRRQRAV